MRSLKLRLTVAFLFVSLISVIILAFVVGQTNTSEFDRYVLDQMRADFITQAVQHYTNTGSWTGFADRYHRTEGPRPTPNPDTTAPAPPFTGTVSFRRDNLFVLADARGVVVVPVGSYRTGDHVPAGELAAGVPVEVNGQAVGTVVTPNPLWPRDPREAAYLERTSRGLMAAALAATVMGLLLGLLLANTLTSPLRELTAATRAMARGDLNQKVTVRSRDELGELADSFNQMSAGLSRATTLRRQMTADIAHDLRTPLTVMTGYLESLRDGVLKPSPARFEVMYNEARQLQRLVEDLRTLSLADAGELPLNRTSIAPASLMERTAASFHQRAEEKGVALEVDAAAGLPAVSVDPERMAQVLGNLVANALRYTPAGGRIRLAAAPVDGGARLTVQDTGNGIAPDALPHVFERFYRGDASRHDGESGLGLAIARSLVEAHRGRISVASEPGHGSTFTIDLPGGPPAAALYGQQRPGNHEA